MTVSKIAELLEENEVPLHIITMLHNDTRVTVVRLLQRWKQRQNNMQCEQERIQKLYTHERGFTAEGFKRIVGVDEAGRGPLAGPVVIGAVILPLGYHLPLLNDSKKLSAKQRQTLYYAIKEVAIATSHAIITVDRIDQDNIYQATVAGMYQAISKLQPQPDMALIDAVPLPDLTIPACPLIGGDAISASIAAASIIAKVERDNIMQELNQQFPMYGFAKHKGYGTAEHLLAIQKYGPCPIHRRSFEPIKSWGCTSL
jgi:ribonuclease HII